VKAFPDAKVVATAEVVKHIEAPAKLAFCPQMKDGAPAKLYTPQVIAANTFTIDGEKVEIRQPQHYAAFVWIPANKAILGGTGVARGYARMDGRYPERRKPLAVAQNARRYGRTPSAAGHSRPLSWHTAGGDRAIVFTRDYLQQFEQALKTHKDSAGVIAEMKQRWPELAEVSSLELSAKVNTGEMKW
jgi:hypothetical protein